MLNVLGGLSKDQLAIGVLDVLVGLFRQFELNTSKHVYYRYRRPRPGEIYPGSLNTSKVVFVPSGWRAQDLSKRARLDGTAVVLV